MVAKSVIVGPRIGVPVAVILAAVREVLRNFDVYRALLGFEPDIRLSGVF